MTLPEHVRRSLSTEAAAFLEQYPDLAVADMLAPDMNGILRGKQLTPAGLRKLYSEGVRLPASIYLLDWTGRSVPPIGFGTSDGDPDWYCHPVPYTLRPVPWARRKAAQVLTSMADEHGAPHWADPRHLVARAAEPLTALGLRPVIAIEYEFYLVDRDAALSGTIRPATAPRHGWRASGTNVYGLDELDDFDDLLADVQEACSVQDIPIDTFVAEYAPGQFEVNLTHVDDPVLACDHAILLERAIKEVAKRHGVIATFMAKPLIEMTGSGLHVHVSLLDKAGRNVFAGPLDKTLNRPMSDTLRHAIGGLVQTLPEAMAIFAPNANSYRRLMPGAYAPVNTHWGGDNRTLCLRIPPSDDTGTRIEHRAAGADANPYLVTAAVLAGIHHGISNRIEPPPPCTGDAALEPGAALPSRWEEALGLFSRSEVLPRYLGELYCRCFHDCRRFEADAFHAHIDPLEYEWYLRTA